MRTSVIAAAAVLLALLATPAVAQDALDTPAATQQTGLYTTIQLGRHSFTVDDDGDASDAETGIGGGIEIGYALTPFLAPYAGVDYGLMTSADADGDSYGLTFINLGAQIHLLPGRRVVPFADVAAAIQIASFDVDGISNGSEESKLKFEGYGFTIGAGAKLFVQPNVALSGGLQTTLGSFSTVRFLGESEDVDLGSRDVRFHVGVSFFPAR